MIYLRKLLDMFFLSMVPSLVSFFLMWKFMGYATWLTTCIISTIIFYFGTVLLLRRFIHDIKSERKYYMVHLTTFAIYTALGAILLITDQMYPFTWMFFHTRIFSILTQAVDNQIPVWISYTLTVLIYLLLIIVLHPIFKKSHENEINRLNALNAEQASAELENDSSDSTNADRGHRRSLSDDNTLYSHKEYMKLMNEGNLRIRKRRFSVNKKASVQITENIKAFFEGLGSYSFYQFIYDKKAEGIDTTPIIKNYLNRKLNLHFNTIKEKHSKP